MSTPDLTNVPTVQLLAHVHARVQALEVRAANTEAGDRETERLKATLVRSTELVSELLALTKEPNPKNALDCIAEYLVQLNRNLWDLRYAFDAPREEGEVQP